MKAPVLLQTACTTVYNLGNPANSKEVRIILDTGSQRSYITETVKEHLSLVPVGTETMIIKMFGVETQCQQVCDVLKVGMNLRNEYNLQISFLSVSLYVNPFPTRQLLLWVATTASLPPWI